MPTITRKLLYKEVWSRPLCHIAESYKTSYSELVRACEEMAVPRLSKNHWGLKAMGKEEPAAAPLPEGDGVPEVRTLRERVARKSQKETTALTPTSAEHPLLTKTQKVLAKAKVDDRGVYRLPTQHRALASRVSPGLLSRALGIWALIIGAVEVAGGKIQVVREEGSPNGRFITKLRLDGATLGVELREVMRRTTRAATKEDRWHFLGETVSEHHSTGRLVLSLIGLEGTGARQQWKDSSSSRIEAKLSDFVALVRAGIEAREIYREKQALAAQERERLWRAQEARRREGQCRQAVCDQTLQMKRHWQAARELREFIASALEVVPAGERDEAFTEWVDLARAYADALDPLLSVQRAKRLLTKPDKKTWHSDSLLGFEAPGSTWAWDLWSK